MRYLLLLVSLFALVACSSAKESEAVAAATVGNTPIPTWTPTPLPVATDTATPVPTLTPAPIPTSTPEPTLVPVTLAQVEAAVGLPFQDSRTKEGPRRFAYYNSPFNGLVMIDIDSDLLNFSVAWARVALGDQDAARKFKAEFRTLSILLLNTNAAIESIAFVDACYSDSALRAIAQVKDVECLYTLTDGSTLKVNYYYESNILAAFVKIK